MQVGAINSFNNYSRMSNVNFEGKKTEEQYNKEKWKTLDQVNAEEAKRKNAMTALKNYGMGLIMAATGGSAALTGCDNYIEVYHRHDFDMDDCPVHIVKDKDTIYIKEYVPGETIYKTDTVVKEKTDTFYLPQYDTIIVEKPGKNDTVYVPKIDTVVVPGKNDTIYVPQIDTVVVPGKNDTIYVPQIDTVVVPGKKDTIYIDKVDTVYKDRVDTLIVPGKNDTIYIDKVDTVYKDRVDTVLVPGKNDTIYVDKIDTVYVPGKNDTIYVDKIDTVYVPGKNDTVYVDKIDTVYLDKIDTVYVDKPIYIPGDTVYVRPNFKSEVADTIIRNFGDLDIDTEGDGIPISMMFYDEWETTANHMLLNGKRTSVGELVYDNTMTDWYEDKKYCRVKFSLSDGKGLIMQVQTPKNPHKKPTNDLDFITNRVFVFRKDEGNKLNKYELQEDGTLKYAGTVTQDDWQDQSILDNTKLPNGETETWAYSDWKVQRHNMEMDDLYNEYITKCAEEGKDPFKQ